MSKNRLVLHSAAILVIAFFAFLAISSGATTPPPAPRPVPIAAPPMVTDDVERVISSSTSEKGKGVESIPEPGQKAYDTLGLVFATSVIKYDENGQPFEGQEGIVFLLLREAQKLGGNDILNLRTDENVTFRQTKITNSFGIERMVILRTVTITGSAIAIKYRN
jgi:hypothetical protein